MSSKKEEKLGTIPRYIPLPHELYKLRVRYPSVTEAVTLECAVCKQWVTTKVVDHIPAEVEDPVASSSDQLEAFEELQQTVWKPYVKKTISAERDASAFHSERISKIIEGKVEQLKKRRRGKTAEEENEATAMLASIAKRKLEGGDAASTPPPPVEVCPYYIQNPLLFHCGWTYCEKVDQLMDLRVQWLQTLYKGVVLAQREQEESTTSSEEEAEGKEKVVTPKKPILEEKLLSSDVKFNNIDAFRELLNKTLAEELDFRRNERLANRSEKSGGDQPVDIEKALNSIPQLAATKLSKSIQLTSDSLIDTREGRKEIQQAWVQAAAYVLVHDSDDTVLSCFCWATCEWCGKVRRLAQPFPGGGFPFICSLLPNLTCDTTEMEGIVQYTTQYCGRVLEQIALASPVLPVPLRRAYTFQRQQWLHDHLLPLSREYMKVRKAPKKKGKKAAAPPTEEEEEEKDLLSCVFNEPTVQYVRDKIILKLLSCEPRSVRNPKPYKSREKAFRRLAPVEPFLPYLKDLVAAVKQKTATGHLRYVFQSFKTVQEKRGEVLRQVLLSDGPQGNHAVANTVSADRSPVKKKPSKPSASQETDDTKAERKAPKEKKESVKKERKAPKEKKKKEEDEDVPPQSLPSDTPVKVERRGRPPKNVSLEVVNWVQCDVCDKWRIVPHKIGSTVTFWQCNMRPNTTCDDPDEG
ncbi:CW-type Zinc Finger, putative [Angomonas deanei]|uniref:CW-type Zinc Finger, putative n=1 Tax=Angomonas deanei TaxID=59799 RepID=A0A7G2CHP7_9TRYP|nr:CW-type Zinc Finger, putative [Angomonas deanei]